MLINKLYKLRYDYQTILQRGDIVFLLDLMITNQLTKITVLSKNQIEVLTWSNVRNGAYPEAWFEEINDD